jgi:uncharacterized protein YjbI with pentapeptide repeats
MRRLPLRSTVRRWNPEYDEGDYQRALAGAKSLANVNLTKADLRGADLQGVNFTYASLTRANLDGADLRKAILENVTLRGVTATNANLAGAYLPYAILVGADLEGANLEKANLTHANLGTANLRGANLADAYLNSARLGSANLTGVDLSYARLGGARLNDAALVGADLAHAFLKDADLTRANFEGATLKDADLSGANLSGANLSGANLEGTNFADAEWDGLTRWPRGFVPPVLSEHLTFSDPTGSEAFRRWFGDSVVKDETGRPIVVYHGTTRGGFTAFDPAKTDKHHPGFYLTDDILTANTYVGKLKAPLLDPALEGATDGAYRLYIKMERPFVHDAEGGQWDDLHIPQFPNKRKTYEVAHAVKDTGLYDGVILKNLRDSGRKTRYDKPADVYVVFDPKNIKSATTNVGTYDPNDPDIRRNPRRSPRSSRRRSRR